MHYVMADIHGDYGRYQRMLEKIGLSESDELYIIGDMIDRHRGGIKIVRDVMTRENVKAMLGNHEQMCLDAFDHVDGAAAMWKMNGGSYTLRELKYKMTAAERGEILRFFRELPIWYLLCLGDGRSFVLVHGKVGVREDDSLWGRYDVSYCPRFNANLSALDPVLITGHTPVCYLEEPYGRSGDEVLRDLKASGEHMKIFHGNHVIDVDCGCGNDHPACRLACLRLEDMKEFYV